MERAMSLRHWALVFVVIVLITAVSAFGGLAAVGADGVRVSLFFFVTFLTGFLVLLVLGLWSRMP
jgi:uncharacterized membrane protein YtjA (UPF0391 family)